MGTCCYILSKYLTITGNSISPVEVFILLLFSVSILVTSQGNCQQLPANIGFENGTFSGWSGATGQCCPVYTPTQGIDTARHVITSGNFTDPYSNGVVEVVAPGSLFSARLGNNSGSAESENLEYSFTVPSDSLLLVLRFAVILENGNHPPVKQSRFKYEITGNPVLTEGCLSEQVTAGDTAIDFIYNGAYEILNWQTRVVNLTGLQGTTVSTHFETGDCEPGGHFGYAYVDGELKEAKLTGIFCNPNGSITLFAPVGLHGKWFNGSTADSINISQPLAGNNYTLDLEYEHGCMVTLSQILDDIVPESNFTVTPVCDLEYTFQNNSVCGSGSLYYWEFGDGQSQQLLSPAHTYNAPGAYEVTLTVQQSNNCTSVYSENIIAEESVKANFSVEENCIDMPVIFNNSSISTTGSAVNYSWFINNQLSYSSPSPEHIFYQPGTYQVLLVATDANLCSDSAVAELVIADTEHCNNEPAYLWFPNAFTPNGDGINDLFEAVSEKGYRPTEITVFNRFGAAVYSGTKWDGNSGGYICPGGVYSYSINHPALIHGKSTSGTVILMR